MNSAGCSRTRRRTAPGRSKPGTASSWTDLITGVALGGATTQTISFANTNAYIIYRMVQTGGATSSSPWIQEVEFKIAQGAALASAATDYSNAGGSGDRQSSITVSTDISLAGGSIAALVDGNDEFRRV